jgi:hypothetical protein
MKILLDEIIRQANGVIKIGRHDQEDRTILYIPLDPTP